ncbi:hypothetical protein J6590_030553 [Homalodisca vitripennis]|nr:hypothetical protein J6590_030553 [Homalodisca vitripennis]
MMMLQINLLWSVLLVTESVVSGARILAVLPNTFHSHFAFAHSILSELGARGHEVTVYSTRPAPDPLGNITHIQVVSGYKELIDSKF